MERLGRKAKKDSAKGAKHPHQLKRSSGSVRKHIKRILGSAVAMCVLVASVCLYHVYYTRPAHLRATRQMIRQYIEEHQKDTWSIIREPRTERDMMREIALDSATTNTLTACLAGTKLPAVKEWSEHYKDRLHITHLTPQGGTRSIIAKAKGKEQLDPRRWFEVVVYGAHVAHLPMVQRHLVYLPAWKAVAIPAQHMTPLWRCAFFIHEVGHAYLDKDSSTPGDPFMSDAWVYEEVRMHTIEAQYLNEQTEGAYYALLDTIAARQHERWLATPLAGIERSDLVKLDGLFEKASQGEVSKRIAQYLFDMSRSALDRTADGREATKHQQIKMYVRLFAEMHE